MLIQESHVDVSTSTTPMRLFLFHPVLSSGLKARFPAVAVFTEIYQVTAPITRFCRQLAGRGFIVASCSSYHEFMGPEALAYDDQGIPLTWLIQGQRWAMI
jgi:carboxymethylenebutenolidase